MNKCNSDPDSTSNNYEYWNGYRDGYGYFEAIELLKVIPCIRQLEKEE